MEKYFCYSNRHSFKVEVAQPFTDINLHRLLKLERKHAMTMSTKLCFCNSDKYDNIVNFTKGMTLIQPVELYIALFLSQLYQIYQTVLHVLYVFCVLWQMSNFVHGLFVYSPVSE